VGQALDLILKQIGNLVSDDAPSAPVLSAT
jgi:hypothetical protein